MLNCNNFLPHYILWHVGWYVLERHSISKGHKVQYMSVLIEVLCACVLQVYSMSGRPVCGADDSGVSAVPCWHSGTWSERVGCGLVYSLWRGSDGVTRHPVHHFVSLQLHRWTTLWFHATFWVWQLYSRLLGRCVTNVQCLTSSICCNLSVRQTLTEESSSRTKMEIEEGRERTEKALTWWEWEKAKEGYLDPEPEPSIWQQNFNKR